MQGILGSVGSMFSTPPEKQVEITLPSSFIASNSTMSSIFQVDTHWMFESGIMDVFIMLGPGTKDVSR